MENRTCRTVRAMEVLSEWHNEVPWRNVNPSSVFQIETKISRNDRGELHLVRRDQLGSEIRVGEAFKQACLEYGFAIPLLRVATTRETYYVCRFQSTRQTIQTLVSNPGGSTSFLCRPSVTCVVSYRTHRHLPEIGEKACLEPRCRVIYPRMQSGAT